MAENGDAIIVDGEDGTVHLRPHARPRGRLCRQGAASAPRRQEQSTASCAGQAVDDQGRRRRSTLLHECRPGSSTCRSSPRPGAAGIGLFRTELQFMVASTFPRAEEQETLYRDVLDAARGKPVTFRTLDIGGDKVLPYFKRATQEENPALGWRAIRLALDRPGLLRTQIRALLKAGGGRELKLMLPMVTELGEIAQAREIIDREVRHLSRFAPPSADQPASSAP